MSIEGTWNCVMNGAMGKQEVTIALTNADGTLQGKLSAPLGEEPILDGLVQGDTASWKCAVTKPVKLTLEFTVKIAGDTMSGNVKLGMFGKCLLSGKRA